jgi:hypothetical protein
LKDASSSIRTNLGISLSQLSANSIEKCETIIRRISKILEDIHSENPTFSRDYAERKMKELSKEFSNTLGINIEQHDSNNTFDMKWCEEKLDLLQIMKDYITVNEANCILLYYDACTYLYDL